MAKKQKKLTHDQVKHVASLARLSLSEKEIQKFQKQLSTILEYFTLLNEVDTDKVEPTSQVTGLKDVVRQDEKPQKSLSSKEALSNAPQKHQDYFKVKGIFEEE
jgi:aspartyl-tRNA(Asn)/glutamyl-tRNA(Gln) amidotransferase subunit C